MARTIDYHDIWFGLLHVKTRKRPNDMLSDVEGAYTQLIAKAHSKDEYPLSPCHQHGHLPPLWHRQVEGEAGAVADSRECAVERFSRRSNLPQRLPVLHR